MFAVNFMKHDGTCGVEEFKDSTAARSFFNRLVHSAGTVSAGLYGHDDQEIDAFEMPRPAGEPAAYAYIR